MVEILLVRHAQSQWQLARDENWNTPLSTLGEKQAARLAWWLARSADIAPAALWSSPLERATQTAAPVARALNLPVALAEDLQEADFWIGAYLPTTESPGAERPDFRPEEPYRQYRATVARTLAAMVETADAAGGPILVITHGGFIATLLRLISGSDWASYWLYNATLNRLQWQRGRWHIVYLNRWEHLPPAWRTS